MVGRQKATRATKQPISKAKKATQAKKQPFLKAKKQCEQKNSR